MVYCHKNFRHWSLETHANGLLGSAKQTPINWLINQLSNRLMMVIKAKGARVEFHLDVCSKMPSVIWRCWFGGRKGIQPVKTEWWVLAWLFVWSTWPSWCHCHSLSLASVKSRLVLPFWYRLAWVVPDNGPLNKCVCVCVCVCVRCVC